MYKSCVPLFPSIIPSFFVVQCVVVSVDLILKSIG